MFSQSYFSLQKIANEVAIAWTKVDQGLCRHMP